jgi:hypothetical protein
MAQLSRFTDGKATRVSALIAGDPEAVRCLDFPRIFLGSRRFDLPRSALLFRGQSSAALAAALSSRTHNVAFEVVQQNLGRPDTQPLITPQGSFLTRAWNRHSI